MAQAPNLHNKIETEGLTAGIDEAGRGCLAGPVVAAAVILPEGHGMRGLKDSKLLSPARRAKLSSEIRNCSVWSIGLVWPKRIDKINILQGSLLAMAKAVSRLAYRPEGLLIDGPFTIPEAMLLQVYGNSAAALPSQQAVIKGDRILPSVSAASIIAKHFRDQLMLRLARIWPQYGFEKHKGYGTKEHLDMLRKYGPCKLHRLTFKGVQETALSLFTAPSP